MLRKLPILYIHAGAAAWLPDVNIGATFSTLDLSERSHLVVATNITFTSASADDTSAIHVVSGGHPTLTSRLDAEIEIKDGASLLLDTGVIEVIKSATIRGHLGTLANTELIFGGNSAAALKMIPTSAPKIHSVQLHSLHIKADASVDLQQSTVNGYCGYELRVIGIDKTVVMEEGSSLSVACTTSLDVLSVILNGVQFDTASQTTGTYSGTSTLRTSSLTVTGQFNAGRMSLVDCNSLTVGSSATFIFEPQSPPFQVHDIVIEGNMTSIGTLSVHANDFSITAGGSVSWPRGSDSMLDCNTVTIDGLFRPGILATGSGFDLFQVGVTGDVLFTANETFKADIIRISGSVVIDNSVIFEGRTQRLMTELTIQETGELLLDSTNSQRRIFLNDTSEIHAEHVQVSGILHAGRLAIGVGWQSLQVGGILTVQAHGDFPINEMTIGGTFDVLNEIVIRGRNQTTSIFFTTLEGSLVTFDSQRFDNGGIADSTMSDERLLVDKTSEIHTERVNIGGTVHAGRLTIGGGWQSLQVEGLLTLQAKGDFPINEITIGGKFDCLNHIVIKSRNESESASFTTLQGSEVTFDSGRFYNSSTELNFSQLIIHEISIDGEFQAHELEFPQDLHTITVGEHGSMWMTSVGK